MKGLVVLGVVGVLAVLAAVVVGQRGEDARRWQEMRCEAAVSRRAWLEKEWLGLYHAGVVDYRQREAVLGKVYAVLQDARNEMQRECGAR